MNIKARTRKLRLLTVLMAGAVALGACAQYKENRDPQISDLVLDSNTMPEVNRISVPMPDAQPYMPPKRAEASSLWGSKTKSFFGDRRAKNVGDLLTVMININDQAQLRNATERSRSNTQESQDPSFFGYGSQIDKILPGVDPADLPTGGNIVDLNSASGAKGEGTIRRNESISLRVAAVIIKVLPNGNFVIAGRQEVKVNYELRELRIAGIVRSVDINLDNTINYDKIAEARIAYGGKGQLTAVQRPRYGQDFLEVILPY
jgi:flagellar L-ring protein precursor FlgH